ncbi:hypothetical protein RDn1_280 [Candidatus Termititenax dinenymphae]|uniref:DUF2281 domain-containing protein n=1 Tax=Candidatus Termititenax dinenymphae TaxID=2218523 RepID=A0A388TLC6_9BACT|nr:hypothetical protein RDn1_280 [Candidatus Termititenax dinenymphae]
MQKTKIKTIEKYLTVLPDSAVDQVISFVSYLGFMKNIDSEYPYPDEKAAIDQYRKKPGKTFAWDAVKASL